MSTQKIVLEKNILAIYQNVGISRSIPFKVNIFYNICEEFKALKLFFSTETPSVTFGIMHVHNHVPFRLVHLPSNTRQDCSIATFWGDFT